MMMMMMMMMMDGWWWWWWMRMWMRMQMRMRMCMWMWWCRQRRYILLVVSLVLYDYCFTTSIEFAPPPLSLPRCNVVAGCIGRQRSAGHHEKVVKNVPPKARSLQRGHPAGFMQPGCSARMSPLHWPDKLMLQRHHSHHYPPLQPLQLFHHATQHLVVCTENQAPEHRKVMKSQPKLSSWWTWQTMRGSAWTCEQILRCHHSFSISFKKLASSNTQKRKGCQHLTLNVPMASSILNTNRAF